MTLKLAAIITQCISKQSH